jgi:UMF1 family MFS transporter
VADLTGNIRYGFLFLVFMLWAALPVLTGVDVERGRADAREWSSSGKGDDHEVEEDAVS